MAVWTGQKVKSRAFVCFHSDHAHIRFDKWIRNRKLNGTMHHFHTSRTDCLSICSCSQKLGSMAHVKESHLTLLPLTVDCGIPTIPSNVSVSATPSDTTEGAVVTIQCEEGLTPPFPINITCTRSGREGQWRPDPANIQCHEGITNYYRECQPAQPLKLALVSG